MEYQGGFETFKEASRYMFEAPSLSDVLTVLFILLLAVGGLIVLPYLISKYRLRFKVRESFFSMGRSFDLKDEEIQLLWRCAGKLEEPQKLYSSKVLFEKCVSKIVRQDPSKIDMVGVIRRKLRFDFLPWFLPLTTTREIDLYQTGFVVYKGNSYSGAVWDKNDLELHVAILDTPPPRITQGEEVKFSFLREDDGRYYFSVQVLRTYTEGSKLVLVLPHTENLSKIQLRDSIRWRVSLPARVRLLKPGEEAYISLGGDEEGFTEGLVENISTSGVRVCFDKLIDIKEESGLFINFELKGTRIEAFGRVKNAKVNPERTCIGVKFESLSKEHEETIRKFILEEQRETLKAYKMGELRGGFSS